MNSITKDGPKGETPDPEQKQPEAWDDWFPKKFKSIIDSIRERDQKKISKLFLTEQRRLEAIRAIHRGAETRRFLDSEFWKEFLKPALGDEQDLKPWVPGDPRSLEEVAVDHLFASGKAAFAKAILKKFDEWIRIGEEAKKVVALDTERRDQVRSMAE